MYKRCRTAPSITQSEYGKKKYAKRNLIIPVQYWGDEKEEGKVSSHDNVERDNELVRNLFLERLRSTYSLHYIDRSQKREEEEKDLGNELILYLKNLYFNPETPKPKRLPYTTTRIFGYASSEDKILPLSNYLDTIGRTGGYFMLKNVQKMVASKRRQVIRAKLRINSEKKATVVFPPV